MDIILPFQKLPKERLGIGPSQGLVYALDEEVVLKVPFQYRVTGNPDMEHYLDLSLASFVAMEKEIAVYDTLAARPHANFPRRITLDVEDTLFLERLEPLQEASLRASRADRESWVLELLSAVSWLEKIGFVHGDLAVRNLGVDRSNRLKLFDFGSSISRSHPDFANEVIRDHFSLATCLHFLLSGIDPFAEVRSRAEAENIRAMMEGGRWKIGEGAEKLADTIQDGWTGRNTHLPFHDILEQATRILSAPSSREEHHDRLEVRCRNWLRLAQRNPLWKPVDEYVLACKGVSSLTWSNEERSLLPWGIQKLCKTILDPERKKYVRKHLVTNEEIKYDDETIRESMEHDVLIAIDEHERARVYLITIRDNIRGHAMKLTKARKAVGLDSCIPDD
ncbi:hypothetical protein N0V88_005498 [Collariella sp. IMI 366227]|nr:hypothetical protein N0V88_005498 [Collariella sp. IMI 366227]